MREPAPLARDQRAPNRVPHQSRDTDDREHSPRADADLANIRYLGDARGGEADEGAGGKAVEGGEEDDGHVAARGEPEAEDERAGEEGHEDHGVEAAQLVGDPAGERAAEDGDRVQDGEHVGGQARAHAVCLGVEDDEVEGEEDAEEEET